MGAFAHNYGRMGLCKTKKNLLFTPNNKNKGPIHKDPGIGMRASGTIPTCIFL